MVFLQLSAKTQKVWHELPKMFVLVAESVQRAQFHSGHGEHRTGDWKLLLAPTVPWAFLGSTMLLMNQKTLKEQPGKCSKAGSAPLC